MTMKEYLEVVKAKKLPGIKPQSSPDSGNILLWPMNYLLSGLQEAKNLETYRQEW